jgi:hypothetical protein
VGDGWMKKSNTTNDVPRGKRKIYKKGFTGAAGPETSSTSYFSYFFSTLYFSPVSSLLFFKTGIQKKSIFAPPIIV